MLIKNKFSLITGSAKRLGRDIALGLAGNGSNIIIHYNNSRDDAEKVKQKIKDIGVEVHLIKTNLAETSEIENLFMNLENEGINLDILVNSASTFNKKKFEDISITDWDNSLNVNLKAPFLLGQNFYKSLLNRFDYNKDKNKGICINITDLSGIYPWKNYTQHGVSKAGLIHLTKYMALELSPLMRTNIICPGLILPPSGMSQENSEWKSMLQKIPMKMSGKTENIISAIKFIIENDFINGSMINIDGGEMLIGPINH